MKKIDKILQFIEKEGISASLFERKSGFGATYLAKTKERGSDLTYKSLEKLKTNVPDWYYQIFPEERLEGVMKVPHHGQNGFTETPSHMDQNCNEVRLENQYLKTRVNDLQKMIDDKVEIINLQRELLKSKAGAIGG